MTNEEALALADECISRGTIIAEAYDYSFWYRIRDALEKQIPKKPINWLDKKLICPRCNRADYIKPLEAYCKFCGQAIDWGEEE